MPVPVQQFQRGPGLLSGISAGQNIIQRLLTDPTKQNLLQEQLRRQQLLSQEEQEKLKTLPQTLQAQLGLAQARIPAMQAQTRFTQAGVPLRQAQVPQIQAETALTQEQAKYLPLETLIKAQTASQAAGEQGRLSGRFGPAYSLQKWWQSLSPAQRYTEQAQHPGVVATISSQLAQNVLHPQQAQAAVNYLTPEAMARFGFKPGTPLPTGGAPSPQRAAPTAPVPLPESLRGGALGAGGLMEQLGRRALTPPGMQREQGAPAPLPPPTAVPVSDPLSAELAPGTPGAKLAWPITRSNVEQEGRAAALEANQRVTTMSSRKRNEYAESLEGLLNQPLAQNMMTVLAKYPGAWGWTDAKLKGFLDPKAYADYVVANDGFLSLVSASLKGMEGIQNTDSGTKQANNYFQTAKKLWSSNKPAARQALYNGMVLLQGEANALHRTATPIIDVQRRGRAPIKIPRSFQPPQPAQKGGLVTMIGPKGTFHVPSDQVQSFLNNKYRRG